MACNPSKLLLPKAGYRSPSANKAGGEDRTFSSLNGAYGYGSIEIQIDGADSRSWVGGDLLGDFGRRSSSLRQRSMEPPTIPMAHQRGTAQLRPLG